MIGIASIYFQQKMKIHFNITYILLTLGDLCNCHLATVVHWTIVYLLLLLLTNHSQKYLELHVYLEFIFTCSELGLQLSLLQECYGEEGLRTWTSKLAGDRF